MTPNHLHDLSILAKAGSNAALVTFLLYVAAVFGLAWLSNKLLQSKSFLSEYFLGSRGLGVWAFALTFAATSSSGGSFTGFPSKIYTHGWILGLWIGSYIVVPICAMGLLGKRINQVARISGSITVPDVLRDRFRSPMFGLVAVALIVFFMSFNLVAQFKSGAEILRTLLQDVGAFTFTSSFLGDLKNSIPFIGPVEDQYFLCLLTFAVAVIIYTAYGGFRAVVWTDVMQGVVMVLGVMIMLPLAIYQVGGMGAAADAIAKMQPPRLGLAHITFSEPPEATTSVTSPWFAMPRAGQQPDTYSFEGDDNQLPRLIRVSHSLSITPKTTVIEHAKIVEITTPDEIRRQARRLQKKEEVADVEAAVADLQNRGMVWLDSAPELRSATLEITLIKGYRYGAKQPGVYTKGPGPSPPKLPQKPATLLIKTSQAGAIISIRDADGKLELVRTSTGEDLIAVNEGTYTVRVERTGFEPSETQIDIVKKKNEEKLKAGAAFKPAATVDVELKESSATTVDVVTEPKMPASNSDGFMPLSIAISFFFMWAISGAGQPSSMVRLMAFKDSNTLRRSIFTVTLYYSMIYFPLVIIFVCARIILPGMDLESDRIMPQMAVTLTTQIGQGWLAGLLVAAPFAAVMSTVDSFLLMISSGLVRDIYQRNINPSVSEKRIKLMSYVCTLLVGTGAMLGAVNPPQFLQDIIVYTGSGLAACFLAPMVFALYWPRANSQGCLAGMLAGFGAHLAMYIGGAFINGSFFSPYQLFDFSPIIIGLAVSFVAVIVATKMTAPPPQELVRKYFCKRN